MLHYVRNDCKLREGEMVLIDAGCELEGYASDVTRTYPIGGRFSGPGRAIYEVVLASHSAPRSTAAGRAPRCRPSTTRPYARSWKASWISACSTGEVDDLVANEAHRPYYMHNTSHWLGLDVHDVGSYREAGEPRKLERGMVFTVEPGLYIAAGDVDTRFHGIGVRIEDDVVITEDGYENLTSALPVDPDAVAALVAEGPGENP